MQLGSQPRQCPCVQVLATIKRGPAVKRRLALALLAISCAFVRARRVVEGVALQYAHAPRPALAYLWAAATAALLWPLHQCARSLPRPRAPPVADFMCFELELCWCRYMLMRSSYHYWALCSVIVVSSNFVLCACVAGVACQKVGVRQVTHRAPSCRLAKALVFGKVRAALGIRQGVVSGGGSLAPHLDDFYEAIGLPVINGWGLTVRVSPYCGRISLESVGLYFAV